MNQSFQGMPIHIYLALVLALVASGCASPVLRSTGVLGPISAHPRLTAFSGDGRYFAQEGDDRVIRIWSISSGRLVSQFPSGRPEGYVYGNTGTELTFSPDGRWLAAIATDGQVRLWSVRSGQLERVLVHSTSGEHATSGGYSGPFQSPPRVQSVAFHPSGDWLVTAAVDGWVKIWEVLTGTLVRRIGLLNERRSSLLLTDVAFTPDGQLLLAAGLGRTSLPLINFVSGEPMGVIDVPFPATHLAFNADGSRLLVASYGETVVQTFPRGDVLLRLNTFGKPALSPSGRVVATRPPSFTDVYVYSVDSGVELAHITSFPQGGGSGVMFDGRGRLVAINAYERMLQFWVVPD